MKTEPKVKVEGKSMDKVQCECGAVLTRKNLSTHLKTQKHIDAMAIEQTKKKSSSNLALELATELPSNALGHILSNINSLREELHSEFDDLHEALESIFDSQGVGSDGEDGGPDGSDSGSESDCSQLNHELSEHDRRELEMSELSPPHKVKSKRHSKKVKFEKPVILPAIPNKTKSGKLKDPNVDPMLVAVPEQIVTSSDLAHGLNQ